MSDGLSPIHKLVIGDTAPRGGTDPMLAAALMGGNSGGLFGGGGNGLMALLLGAFLFGGRNGGFFGGGNSGVGGDALAAQSLVTPKDTNNQLAAFQAWAASNAQTLSTQLCTSSAAITSAVNALTPQMFQSFAAQAQQMCNGFHGISRDISAAEGELENHLSTLGTAVNTGFNGIEKTLDSGFAAAALAQCQTQNLINSSSCDIKFTTAQQFTALAQQLANCCCENRLAVANQNALIERSTAAIQTSAAANYAALSNQLNMQTCDIKQAILADGAATRALIQANETDRLREQLADAKAALSNCQQTGNLSTIANSYTQQVLAAIAANCGNDKGSSK